MTEENSKDIRLSIGLISLIGLLVIQILIASFGYGVLTQQVKFNRELIQTYQNNQISIMMKLDDLNNRMTRIETILAPAQD